MEQEPIKQKDIDAVLDSGEFRALAGQVRKLKEIGVPESQMPLSDRFNGAHMPVRLSHLLFDGRSNSPRFIFSSLKDELKELSFDKPQLTAILQLLKTSPLQTPIVQFNFAQFDLARCFEEMRLAARKSGVGVPAGLIQDAQKGEISIEAVAQFLKRPAEYGPVVLEHDHHRGYTKNF